MIKKNKGQTSIEALLAIPLLVSFIFVVFVFFTSARSLIWAQYQLHEAIICLQDQPRLTCHSRFQEMNKRYLTFWKIENLKLNKGSRFDSGQMLITLSFVKTLTLEIKKRVPHE